MEGIRKGGKMRQLLEGIMDRQLLGTIGLVVLAALIIIGMECVVFLATRYEAIIIFSMP